jgi:hypothetical protein
MFGIGAAMRKTFDCDFRKTEGGFLFPDISAVPRAMQGNMLLEQQQGLVKIINLNVSWLFKP